ARVRDPRLPPQRVGRQVCRPRELEREPSDPGGATTIGSGTSVPPRCRAAVTATGKARGAADPAVPEPPRGDTVRRRLDPAGQQRRTSARSRRFGGEPAALAPSRVPRNHPDAPTPPHVDRSRSHHRPHGAGGAARLRRTLRARRGTRSDARRADPGHRGPVLLALHPRAARRALRRRPAAARGVDRAARTNRARPADREPPGAPDLHARSRGDVRVPGAAARADVRPPPPERGRRRRPAVAPRSRAPLGAPPDRARARAARGHGRRVAGPRAPGARGRRDRRRAVAEPARALPAPRRAEPREPRRPAPPTPHRATLRLAPDPWADDPRAARG